MENNTFFKIPKNRKCLYIRHLRFLRYQIFTKILLFDGCLSGGEACYRHAEWRTTCVVHAYLVTFTVTAWVYLKDENTNKYYMSEEYIDENHTTGLFFEAVAGEDYYTEKMYAPAGKSLTYSLEENSDGSYTLSYKESDVATEIGTTFESDTEVRIYTLTGVEVSGRHLPAGMYIVKSGGKVTLRLIDN